MTYSNGRLPKSALSRVPGGRLAKGGAARSYLAMRYFIGRKYGVWLSPTGPNSTYRTYAKQVQYWNDYQAGRGPIAARPGTSNHGWGRACDLPSPVMQMKVRQHGKSFGWLIGAWSDAPTEPWHMRWSGHYTIKARAWYWRYRRATRKKRT